MGTPLIPSFKDRDVLVRLDGEPGTSNRRMTRVATDVSRELRQIEGVDNVGAHVGRAITGDQIVDVNSSELWVSLDPDADYDATLASIRNSSAAVRGVDGEVVAYSTQKIRDVGALGEGDNAISGNDLDVLTGSGEPLVVRVYGQDPATFSDARRAACVETCRRVDGVSTPRIELPDTQPTLEIEIDLDRAQRAGVKPGDVRRAAATLLQGTQVGSVFEHQKVFDVVVKGVPAARSSVASVRNLLIDRPGGGHVRLGRVADVQRRSASGGDSARGRVAPRRHRGGRERAQRRVGRPPTLRPAWRGSPSRSSTTPRCSSRRTGEELGGARMLGFTLAAAIATFLLLQAAFRSWRLAILAFATLPLALVGGVVAALDRRRRGVARIPRSVSWRCSGSPPGPSWRSSGAPAISNASGGPPTRAGRARSGRALRACPYVRLCDSPL